MEQAVSAGYRAGDSVSGEFVTLGGERYYAIRNVDRMAPFFISVISSADHWLFVSSTGGLTAGRVSPETALFPYVPVDKVHECFPHTGPKTVLRVQADGQQQIWEPFNRECEARFAVSRHLYKNMLGNKLCFEEINHDLQLGFRYTWMTSDQFGFVRHCELQNVGGRLARVEVLDGLQNILPAGAPLLAQTNASNLVDAYKWTELDEPTGLGVFSLYSGISDRAEPCESLKANTVFATGLEEFRVLLSSEQLDAFRAGTGVEQEVHKRGIRGAYLVSASVDVAPGQSQQWNIVADVEQSQGRIVALRNRLQREADIEEAIAGSVDLCDDELARIMAAGDGFQVSAEENVTTHHYANVLFNILRGGIFDDQYNVSSKDFSQTVRNFNRCVYERNEALLNDLEETLDFNQLVSMVRSHGDPQLERLCYEYLPITFGRRHGDPSRPWNRFAIRLKDESGNRLLSYQGNWRDIFQNWEALTYSYPEFIENVIAKFVNASTMDGYNPYRITKEGIDWEVEDPEDPWSYIGYWGDHQIIYLLKLLELSEQFHPSRLEQLLHQPVFSYANVPYRIKSFEDLLDNPKDTVVFDHALAKRIEQRVTDNGADGKLVLNGDGEVYRVTLLEKLLVPLLAKLGNLVLGGGIWLNTQRPEWNDANNALVGHGLSMVTLYYMRRYVRFLQELIARQSESVDLSREVSDWLADTASALESVRPLLGNGRISAEQRFQTLQELGQAASDHRETVYRQDGFSGKVKQSPDAIRKMLGDALAAIDHSISVNRRVDGLYNAYNLLALNSETAQVDALYPMLEGQVAALSSGAIPPREACSLLEALFESDIYRPDQQSFMLYPDRKLPGFFDKNSVPEADVMAVPLLARMVDAGDDRIISRDVEGTYRFNADFRNAADLEVRLEVVKSDYGDEAEAAREDLLRLYEKVFNHRAFTGRSGAMFGFEGLGSIYWHMVSKLLLAIQEIFFAARARDTDEETCSRLAALYYAVREGIGFNKTPSEYGAFPMDPYSHTPKHAGARQPGMTGQVKEEILTRFGELGVRVRDGAVHFEPGLLRELEFSAEPRSFRYLDVRGDWQEIEVPGAALAFTWCQVPVVYRLEKTDAPALTLIYEYGMTENLPTLSLPDSVSAELFLRSGHIRQIDVRLSPGNLLSD
ncbi:MAG: hypothetical protein GWP60_13585 [Gammaproteobacteria bacterium]|jgi:hypothetical protein|nr:hypothetical protein [Gammaproteobacteria bacterium]